MYELKLKLWSTHLDAINLKCMDACFNDLLNLVVNGFSDRFTASYQISRNCQKMLLRTFFLKVRTSNGFVPAKTGVQRMRNGHNVLQT